MMQRDGAEDSTQGHMTKRRDVAAGDAVCELAHDWFAERADRNIESRMRLILQHEKQVDEAGTLRFFDQMHAFDQEHARLLAVLFSDAGGTIPLPLDCALM